MDTHLNFLAPIHIRRWIFSSVTAFAMFGFAAGANAQATSETLQETIGHLIVPVTQGRGPGENVVRFEVSKEADKFRFPDASITALSHAMDSRSRTAVRDAQLALGIQAFGDTQGAFGAMGTLAEHAGLVKSFSGINTALNNIGFVFALGQVARDAANGNTDVATYGALKAIVNYSIGRWGSSALQIAGIATFAVDVTLREWQAGLTDIGVNVWSCRYDAYYRGNSMSVSDWKVKALGLYEAAKRDAKYSKVEKKSDIERFNIYLDGALNEYVHRAFNERNLEFYSECNGSYFGDTEAIQRLIEAEHKGTLENLMVEYVLPEISDRAWGDSLKQQVSNANSQLKRLLNQTIRLEVTTYDAPEGARVVMPLPNGGEWRGKLRPEGTFRTKLTYYAMMKAGFPDRVRLESTQGSEEHELIIADGIMTTVFGVPQTALVVRYKLTEEAQTCDVRRIEASKPISNEQQSRDARPPTTIDLAQSRGAAMFLGHYNLGSDTWSPASPGRRIEAGLLFGPPYLDNIQGLKNCGFDLFNNQSLARGTCTIERFERKIFGENKTIERLCTSAATMELIGIFTSLGGGEKQYFAMDTPAGRAAIDMIKKSLSKVMGGNDPTALLRNNK